MSFRLGLWFFLFFMCALSSAAVPNSCRSVLQSEATVSARLQREIEDARAVVSGNNFVTTRSLIEYKMKLHPDFSVELSRLGPEQTWMDLGGGRGIAVEQFLRDFPDPKRAPHVVLVSYRLGFLRRVPDFEGRFRVFKGRYWESIPQHEIPRVDLVTDVFGVLSYTHDLSLSLQKVFDSLIVGGHLFLHATDYITRIRDGSQVLGLTAFLSTIKGLEVEGQYGILKIKKTQEKILVPKLNLVGLENGERPAVRIFDRAQ